MIRKRVLLWDYTNTRDVSWTMDKVNFKGPLLSASNWNPWYPTELKKRLPFRPMIRGKGNLIGSRGKTSSIRISRSSISSTNPSVRPSRQKRQLPSGTTKSSRSAQSMTSGLSVHLAPRTKLVSTGSTNSWISWRKTHPIIWCKTREIRKNGSYSGWKKKIVLKNARKNVHTARHEALARNYSAARHCMRCTNSVDPV